jgi:hypothetical protein
LKPGGHLDEARLRGPGVVRVQGFDGSPDTRPPATTDDARPPATAG